MKSQREIGMVSTITYWKNVLFDGIKKKLRHPHRLETNLIKKKLRHPHRIETNLILFNFFSISC